MCFPNIIAKARWESKSTHFHAIFGEIYKMRCGFGHFCVCVLSEFSHSYIQWICPKLQTALWVCCACQVNDKPNQKLITSMLTGRGGNSASWLIVHVRCQEIKVENVLLLNMMAFQVHGTLTQNFPGNTNIQKKNWQAKRIFTNRNHIQKYYLFWLALLLGSVWFGSDSSLRNNKSLSVKNIYATQDTRKDPALCGHFHSSYGEYEGNKE